MTQWWRAYSDAVDDPKLQRLSTDLFRAWFNLLCLAARNDGVLPSLADMAFKLRLSEQRMATMLAELIHCRLFDKTERGIVPHNWDGRQYKSDVSTTRVKRFRKRQRNASETSPETETEAETESGGGGTRASSGMDEAAAIVSEVLSAANLDPEHPMSIGGVYMVRGWLNEGCPSEVILIACKRALASKRDGPPTSFSYFRKAVARERALAAEPLPTVQLTEARHARPAENSLVAAGKKRIAELDAIIAENEGRTGAEGPRGLLAGDSNVRLLPTRGCGSG